MDDSRFSVWLSATGEIRILYYCTGWEHEDDDCVLHGMRLVVANVDYQTARAEAEALAAIAGMKIRDVHAHKVKGKQNDGGFEEY